ncbi:ribonuclease Y [Gemmata sp. JC717]|uniref:ribonuclease Y n=1 Tax=Gemmata algarum TaxID=2975278 RepID=UPI0021BB2C6A|nr:ribonuclease Y [Gemmata algarum]MDY3554155.1 ribonuclease Y [Gemmata algarum]
MDPLLIGGLVVAAVLVSIGGTYLVVRRSSPLSHPVPLITAPDPEALRLAAARGEELIEESRRDADRIVRDAELKARDEAVRRREELSRELELARAEVREFERRVEKREDALEQQHRELARKDKQLDAAREKLVERESALDHKARHLDELVETETKRLHEISGLSRDDAQKLLLERLERELAEEVAKKIRQHEERVKQQAEATAREIVTIAIQRYAAHQTAGATVSTVDIPSDDMKGRIIGREGRNIRTFEKLTGVDVIVDDTPGVVIVSAFDNVRREIARIALTKLIQDGRIHPTRIEEVVAETQAEMEKHIQELGTKAVLDADVPMPHEKLVYLLGRLRFRTSYSQNVLAHSVEVAHLCGIMASELGLNAQLARRCGLLHDVGKAADHEMEGGHPKVGAELAKRYGETSKEVLHAIAGHHDDITIDNIYTVLVASADAISASRPGARRETLEKYVKRLADLEAVACGFPEVDHAFAIQAGRELRVLANAHRTTDADAVRICRDIARAIEQQLDYPGEIKVTVIRESRATDVAK